MNSGPLNPDDINMDDWEEMPNAVRLHKAQSVFSLRISREDWKLIEEAARRRGETFSEFIRKAAVRAAVEDQPGPIEMSPEDAARLRAVLDSLIHVESPSK